MKIENNLDSDNIKQLVWRLAIPSMIAQFVSVLYSIVDRMYIGNIAVIGENALAGVGVCGPIVTLISAFSFLVGAGGAPLMSIKLGQKKEEEAKEILSNCFVVLCIIIVALSVLAFLLKDNLLMWFGASESIFAYANEYLTIYLCGTFFALMTMGMNQFIICQGYAKKGMMAVIIGAVLNIILDPIFIFVLHMGVKGAAIATVLSQMFSCIYVLHILLSKKIPIKITWRRLQSSIVKKVLLIGLSPFFIVASDSILIIGLNALLQRYGGVAQGDKLIACATIVQSFMLIITMPLAGITGGTQTILGYNYGANRPERVMRAEKHILLLSMGFTGIMFIIAHTIPEYFVYLFTQNPEYVKLSVWAIKVYSLMIIPLAIQYTVVDGLSGMGIARFAITLSLFRKIIFMIGIFILPRYFDVTAIFYAEPICDVISAISSSLFYMFGIKKILYRGAVL
ncbi:MAG: MATE family efflux transporter [Lachnospiraceae bacterium]